MKPLSNLSTIIGHYDALLLDLWGVVHDGSHLYSGVHDALVNLRKQNKKIIFVSNAPRRAKKAVVVLSQLGVEESLYDHIITSGELGYQWLAAGKALWGKRYYYIGPGKDADVLNGLEYQRVNDIKQADFLLNVGFGSEEDSAEDWQPLLRASQAAGLPMLCLNPDFEVVKISGERFACAGVLAADYEKLGGKVKYFGKPFADVYACCMELLFPYPLEGEGQGGGQLKSAKEPHPPAPSLKGRGRILAIGDGIATDIAGAVRAGIDSVLVTGGIIKKESPEAVEALCRKHNAMPNYVMPGLLW
jgi:HAD superfamily hydrolase (TIGR01459 family)